MPNGGGLANATKQCLRILTSSPLGILTEVLRTSSCRQQRLLHQLLRRGQLKTMSLTENPIFKTVMSSPELQQLRQIFDKYNHTLRLAGGPVRDILSGISPKDLDFATQATPDEMKEMFTKEGVRMINAMGEKHGTVTARIKEENFEVTTLRIDKTTDGRRAEVEYTRDWRQDACRRDLTINSMFLDMTGTLYDYFDGQTDLADRRIRFVGEPAERIQEDYLRIMRYFRFYGRIAKDVDSHDEEALRAIAQNVEGLKIISGERLWMEWSKILNGRFPGELTLKMLELGLGNSIGLPAQPDIDEFRRVYERCQKLQLRVNPITLITALLRNEKDMLDLHGRLRLSAFERELGLFIIANREVFTRGLSELEMRHHFQFLILSSKSGIRNCLKWSAECLHYHGHTALAKEIAEWSVPKFPISGVDVHEAGCPKSRVLSAVLHELKRLWVYSDFGLSKDELMSHVQGILEKVLNEAVNSNKESSLSNKRRKS